MKARTIPSKGREARNGQETRTYAGDTHAHIPLIFGGGEAMARKPPGDGEPHLFKQKKGFRKKDLKPKEILPTPPKAYDVDNYVPGEKLLTDKQALFVMEYVRDGNGARAAQAAGVDPGSASNQAYCWLNDTKKYGHVIKAVRQAFADKRASCEIDAKEVVRELAHTAFLNIKDVVDENDVPLPISQMPDHVTSAIKRLKISHRVDHSAPDGEDGDEPQKVRIIDIEFHDKLGALKQLAQHLGLLKESDHYHQHVHIDWNGLFNRRPPEVIKQQDFVEGKLAEMERLALPAPPPPDESTPKP